MSSLKFFAAASVFLVAHLLPFRAEKVDGGIALTAIEVAK